MKTKANPAIKELRRLTGKTQGEFAEMIGASKDTVVSWELGRNKVSSQFARRIAFATGAMEEPLLKGHLIYMDPVMESGKTYTESDFENYRKLMRGRSDEAEAKYHLKQCAETLELLFLGAAMRVEGGKMRYPLHGLLASFVGWCERAREDFGLEESIEERLRQRRFGDVMSMSYKEWRELARKEPALAKTLGYVEDRGREDEENLRMEVEMRPGWAPGRSMQPRQAAVKVPVALEEGTVVSDQ